MAASNTLLWHTTRSQLPVPSPAVILPSASTAGLDETLLDHSANKRPVILVEALPEDLFTFYRKAIINLLGERQNELASADVEAYHHVCMNIAGAHESFHTDVLKLSIYYAAKLSMDIDAELRKTKNPLLFLGGQKTEPVTGTLPNLILRRGQRGEARLVVLPNLILRRGQRGEARLVVEFESVTAGGSIMQGLESQLDLEDNCSLRMELWPKKYCDMLNKARLRSAPAVPPPGAKPTLVLAGAGDGVLGGDALILSRPLSADHLSHSLISYLLHALLLPKDAITPLSAKTKDFINNAAALAQTQIERAKRPHTGDSSSRPSKRPRGEEEGSQGAGEATGRKSQGSDAEEIARLRCHSTISDFSELMKLDSLSLDLRPSHSTSNMSSSTNSAASPLSSSSSAPSSASISTSSSNQTLLRAPVSTLKNVTTPPSSSPTTGHTSSTTSSRSPPPFLAIGPKRLSGAHGTVYTGALGDGSLVSIKCGTPEIIGREASFYERQFDLNVPKYYGVWRSEDGKGIIEKEGNRTAALLLEYGGSSLKYFGELTRVQRESLYSTLLNLHQVGFEHGDFRPNNVLVASSDDCPKLIDFTLVDEDHICRGEGVCAELKSAKMWLEI